MLLVSPPYVRQKKTIIDKNLIFVLDSSGSMSGEKIKQAKNAVKFIINHLHENDKFALIDFDDGVNLFSTKMVSATPEDRENALRFVDQIVDSGGTNINDALYQAMRMVDRGDRPTYILFLTDGQPTVGVRSTSDILKNIKGANDFQTRIFVFGVGSDINTGLLDFISKENRGTSIYVVDEGNLEVAISSYYEKISSPILSNINIDFERIQVRDVYPRELPDMFKGSQLVLIGKYEGKGPVTVALSGKIGKKEQQFVLKRQKLVDEESYNFLPRLWATRRVGYLLEEIRLHGEEGELVEEIKELGIKFGIVTPYTSFLVKEDDEVAQSGTTFSDRFISDMQVRGREYQSLLRRAEKVRIPDQDKYQSDTPNVKGSRSRDFKATVDGIINVGPMTGSSIPQAGTDAAEELEIILSGAGAEFSREEGTTAIRMAKAVQDIKKKDQAFESTSEKIKYKEDKTFYLKEGYWVDSDYKEGSPLKEIQFNSDEYFQLISEKPGIVKYLSVGKKLIICFEGMNYKIIEEDQAD